MLLQGLWLLPMLLVSLVLAAMVATVSLTAAVVYTV